MSAALSIRLALLLSISNIDIAFFDEPTANLDPEKRMNLANCIRKIKGLNQLFVISHDDTFENLTEKLIVFEKDSDESTKVTTKNSSRTGLGGV
jgi:exonuclease SbcC